MREERDRESSIVIERDLTVSCFVECPKAIATTAIITDNILQFIASVHLDNSFCILKSVFVFV